MMMAVQCMGLLLEIPKHLRILVNSMSVGTSIINGGTGIYTNVTGYGTQKTLFNPEKNYSSGEITLYFTK